MDVTTTRGPISQTASQATAPLSQPPPRHEADLRPSADAAALTRDPRPAAATLATLPVPSGAMPLAPPPADLPPLAPASLGQVAEVSRALMGSLGDNGGSAAPREGRVLKPFGVAMLPADEGDRANGPPGDCADHG